MKTYLVIVFTLTIVGALFLISPASMPVMAAEPVQHRVVKGDDLHLLAAYYYQDPRRWREIYETNRSVVGDPNQLDMGMVLAIPGENLKPFPAAYMEWRDKVGK